MDYARSSKETEVMSEKYCLVVHITVLTKSIKKKTSTTKIGNYLLIRRSVKKTIMAILKIDSYIED